jgi:hypothetical protein
MTTGGCLCGAIRYEIEGEPLTSRVCWCRLCQYLSSGNASVNAMYRREQVRITGTPATTEAIADSGNHMVRSFCPGCGTQLFSESRERPHLIVVRVGSLDDPGRIRPVMTIWTSAAPPWAVFDPATEQHPGQPAPPASGPSTPSH